MLIKRYFLFVFILSGLVGCSSEYNDYDNWESFETFKQDDLAGKKIDCKALISTTIKRNGSMRHSDWHHDFYDYQRDSDYTFQSCKVEIAASVNEYCQSRLNSVVESYINDTYGDEPGGTYKYHCDETIREGLSHVEDSYDLPTPENGYLVFHRAGEMVNPNDITRISFGAEIDESLWHVTVHTKTDRIKLYYGDRSKWEKTKSELAKSSTNHKV